MGTTRKNLEVWSEARIALNKEVANHPVLLNLLGPLPKDDHGAWLGEVAAYVGVIMNGDYMPMELEHLYPKLFWKLKKKGVIIVS
ncbi:MAG: hypothetical protein COB66_01335 [Coxiella sp. (in: Bacteria)]|nr:MAG: hypothetical protein COB66_01335 [Coxiella sp. (in: g-proteobacteria)]